MTHQTGAAPDRGASDPVVQPDSGRAAGILERLPPLTPGRALLWSAVLAALVYLGSIGNGFAFDDEPIIRDNPVVTEGQWGEAAFGPYWTANRTLYRPTAVLAFTAQWELFDGRVAGFHLVSILLHALATLLVAFLALRLARLRPEENLLRERAPLVAALAGGLFALHPVHVEAVANLVGQGELLAAIGVLTAVHLYLWAPTGSVGRGARLLGVGLCYALALGAKEIAVTLPALLLLVDSIGRGPVALTARAKREIMVFVLLGVILTAYLALRWLALGSLLGEQASPVFFGVSSGARVATALAVVPEVIRLLILPLSLSADYDPAVLQLAAFGDSRALLGGLLLGAIGLLALLSRRSAPILTCGILWVLVSWTPVSNLFFGTGVLLAERTLYLPSVGFAIALAVLAVPLQERVGARAFLTIAGVVGLSFFVRSTTRVPTWFSTFTVHETLAREHPESWRSDRARAAGLMRVGETEEAFEYYEAALAKMPWRNDLLIEYGAILKERRQLDRARELLERAVRVSPENVSSWRLLAELHLIAGRPREAHRVAAVGRVRAGEDAELWEIISEAYVFGGFLPAAIRARRVAAVLEPGNPDNRARLRQLLEVLGTAPDTPPDIVSDTLPDARDTVDSGLR